MNTGYEEPIYHTASGTVINPPEPSVRVTFDESETVKALRFQNERLSQELTEAIALRDKWINYAYVGAVVPPLAGGRKPEIPTAIEGMKLALELAEREITDVRECVLDSCSVDGNPETMSAEDRAEYERLSDLLAQINNAIAGKATR